MLEPPTVRTHSVTSKQADGSLYNEVLSVINVGRLFSGPGHTHTHALPGLCGGSAAGPYTRPPSILQH